MTFKVFVLILLNGTHNIKVSLFQRINNVTLLRNMTLNILVYLLIRSTSLFPSTKLKTGPSICCGPQTRMPKGTTQCFERAQQKSDVCGHRYLVRQKTESPTE